MAAILIVAFRGATVGVEGWWEDHRRVLGAGAERGFQGESRILRRTWAISEPRAASTSACASSSSLNGRRRRRSRRREVERHGIGVGHRDRGDHCVEPLALPLGMSIAAVIAQVSFIAKSSFLCSGVFFLSRHFTVLIFVR